MLAGMADNGNGPDLVGARLIGWLVDILGGGVVGGIVGAIAAWTYPSTWECRVGTRLA